MSDDEQPGERLMFWVNLVGISLATGLLGSFFFLYGLPLLTLMTGMLFGWREIPDR